MELPAEGTWENPADVSFEIFCIIYHYKKYNAL